MARHQRGFSQTATHWAASEDGFGGFTFAEPVEIKCHWEDVADEFIDYTGKAAVSRAIVYLASAVPVGDFLFLGKSTVADPSTLDGAFQVRRYMETPNLRNIQQERRAYL